MSAAGARRVTVDRMVCVGSASCVALAPEVFTLDAERQAVVVDADGAAWELVVEAAESCPVGAIEAVGDGADPTR